MYSLFIRNLFKLIYPLYFMATILQSSLLTNFLYPLLLTFFISFGLLEKTEIFGKGKTQLNAMISLVVGLIFVGAVFPRLVMENLVQFMSVGLIVIFVALMLWGFVSGNNNFTVDGGKKIHKLFVFLIAGALFFAVFWVTGVGGTIVDWLNKLLKLIFGAGTGSFWTNFIFVGVILLVVAIATGWNPLEKKTDWFFKLK